MNETLNEEKKEKAINTIAKCLEMTLRLSKDEYERLTCDEYKRIFGKWTLKELKTLWKLYEDGEVKQEQEDGIILLITNQFYDGTENYLTSAEPTDESPRW